MNKILNIVTGISRFFVNERVNDYRSSFMRNQELMAQVAIEHSRSLMTFSIAALAAIAALNKAVFIPYPKLSIAALVCFMLCALFIILNFLFFTRMLADSQKIITRNFKSSFTIPLNKNIDKVKFKHPTNLTSYASTVLFIIGMLLFMILLTSYIWELSHA